MGQRFLKQINQSYLNLVKKCWDTREVQKILNSKKKIVGLMVSNPKESEGEGEKRESKNKAHRIYKGIATQMTANLSSGTHGSKVVVDQYC